ncbi:hypothetical protein FIBSPDRAFT_886838 [Athelia psychrophila]|uniref:Cleavage/polyadenylation specificity factor A subunit N-terminal domain-containing protein n=1 Tax=Athelia psychrophila TaxID=1759441 RepID=A0A166QA99_9AGAM|nr:hypothetical protein FIBSPDRAFT_886838 [Fibularhizoctonia sp. CBS 109695]
MATVQHADAEHAQLHIVEGGRWLLTSVDGSVTVYDLDHPNHRGQAIIPQYTGMAAPERTTHLSVDVLRNTSTLTFNMAVSQHRRGMGSLAIICSAPDGLLAIRPRTMRPQPGHTFGGTLGNSKCTTADLRDRHYVKRVEYHVEDHTYVDLIEIYVWEESNLHQHEKSVITDTIGRATLRLLPDGRLMVLRIAGINIYEIPPFATVPVFDRYQGSRAAPVMSVLLPGRRLLDGGVSSILVQPSDTYSLIACTNTGIYMVTLSATASHVRLLHAITDEHDDPSFSRLDATHMGWRRAYLVDYKYALAVSYDIEEGHRAGVSGSCAPFFDDG